MLKIWICWVSGHWAIFLNEQANQIAKEMTNSDVMLNWISRGDLIQYQRQRTSLKLIQQYRINKYFLSHGEILTVKQTYSWSASHHEDVLITHLLCEMLIIPALLFHISLMNDDKCNSCLVTDSLEHILFSCDKHHIHHTLGISVLNQICFCSFKEFLNKFCQSKNFWLATLHF